MTTTVTTTTVSVAEAMGVIGALGLIVTVVLIALLIGKEIASGASDDHRIRWSKVLNVGIVPLAVTFVAFAAMRVIEVLS